jgi:hypothetical protein
MELYTDKQIFQVLNLRFKHKLPFKQIQEQTGIGSSSIRMVCSRASRLPVIEKWEAKNPSYTVSTTQRRTEITKKDVINILNLRFKKQKSYNQIIDEVNVSLGVLLTIIDKLSYVKEIQQWEKKTGLEVCRASSNYAEENIKKAFYRRYVKREYIQTIADDLSLDSSKLNRILLGKENRCYFLDWNKKNPKYPAERFRSGVCYTQQQIFKVLDLGITRGLPPDKIEKRTGVAQPMIKAVLRNKTRKTDIELWKKGLRLLV